MAVKVTVAPAWGLDKLLMESYSSIEARPTRIAANDRTSMAKSDSRVSRSRLSKTLEMSLLAVGASRFKP